MFSCLQFLQQWKHTRKQFAFPARQLEREKMNIAVKECRHILARAEDVVLLQNAHDDSGIGHAGDLDIRKIVLDPEALFQRNFKRLDAGASGMDESAIDVEEKQAVLDFGF